MLFDNVQVENWETSEMSEIFSEIFKSEFSVLAVEQNRKLRNKKTRNNISKISEVSEFSTWPFDNRLNASSSHFQLFHGICSK